MTDERQVCPAGWHVPSDKEWALLRHHLGLDTVSHNSGNVPDTALYKKLSGIALKSGFATSSNGKRTCGGAYDTQPTGSWWTVSDYHESVLSDLAPVVGHRIKTYHQENNGYPVRCVKD